MRKKYTTNKSKISLRRKIWLNYQRILLLCKITLVILLLLLFFTSLLDKPKQYIKTYFYQVTAKYGFTLQDVVIEGQKNTPVKDIVDILMADKGTPIFSINISEVKKRLEENKWVKTVIIERKLPSAIYIAIVEKSPIAIWQFKQKLYLIDDEGNRIAPYTIDNARVTSNANGEQAKSLNSDTQNSELSAVNNDQHFESLIHVVGQDANIYAMSLLDDLNKHPNLSKRVKSAVRYGQRRWNLNFDDKFTVKMPEDGFSDAYNYLNFLDKNSKLFDQGYKVLDLRDPNKYYLEQY